MPHSGPGSDSQETASTEDLLAHFAGRPEGAEAGTGDTKAADARQVVKLAGEIFGEHLVFASSFGAEDIVVLDLLAELAPQTRIITLDTGRLPQQTYDVMDACRKHFGLEINIISPDSNELARMTGEHGMNLFYESRELRKLCCGVRKIQPLTRELEAAKASAAAAGRPCAWMSGIRRDQAATRQGAAVAEFDAGFGLLKINPLLEWTSEKVWGHIRERGLPYNMLHDQGYPSIGCLPCTRAVKPGEDERAGRWWWESPENRECGLHVPEDAATARKFTFQKLGN